MNEQDKAAWLQACNEWHANSGGKDLGEFMFQAALEYARRKQEPVDLFEAGNLITLNQDNYPGIGRYFVQLRLKSNLDIIVARVYGNSTEELQNRVKAINTKHPDISGKKNPVAKVTKDLDIEWLPHNQFVGAGEELYTTPPAPVSQEPINLQNAPIGTLAPAINGGSWKKTIRGWEWGSGGSTFPRPGGGWNGELIPPAPVRLTDEEIEECEELAGRSFRRFKSSIRGQLIVPQDSYEWHLAHAVMNALEKKRGG